MSPNWFHRLKRSRHILPGSERRRNGGDALLGLLRGYAASERLDAAGLAERQRQHLFPLAKHCAGQSPHFSRRLKAAGLSPEDLAEPGGLAKLPPLTRRELVEARDSFFCRVTPKGHGAVKSNSTSGSTGEPVTVRRTGLCDLHWLTYTLREHLWHDRDFAGRLAASRFSITEPVSAPGWGPPCDMVLRTGPSSAMPVTKSVEELSDWLLEFDPHYLLVMPSTLAALVSYFDSAGHRPDALRGVRTFGETITPHLREDVLRVLRSGVADIYSSQEGGVMATQCPEEGTYHVSETIILEVVDAEGRACQPGEVGRILVTDLVNSASPLIRYEIGDYAEVGTPCPCGRGLPTIKRFLGRERNLVILPDGTRHWPLVGFFHWDEVFPVAQFQFVQLDRQTVLARMSAADSPTPEQEARLTAIIRESLGHPFEIRYQWQTEPLERGPSGKFEEFICKAE